jgi:hypothetical protein
MSALEAAAAMSSTDQAEADHEVQPRPQAAAATVRFTAFISNKRLSKRYDHAPDGGLEKLSGTQFASGGYYVCEFPAAGQDPDAAGPAVVGLDTEARRHPRGHHDPAGDGRVGSRRGPGFE